jgi:hypothetical protein
MRRRESVVVNIITRLSLIVSKSERSSAENEPAKHNVKNGLFGLQLFSIIIDAYSLTDAMTLTSHLLANG